MNNTTVNTPITENLTPLNKQTNEKQKITKNSTGSKNKKIISTIVYIALLVLGAASILVAPIIAPLVASTVPLVLACSGIGAVGVALLSNCPWLFGCQKSE